MTGHGPSSAHDATATLWARRSRTTPALRVASLLVGLDAVTLDDAVVLALAASDEATALLDGMEVRVRTLPTRTVVEPVRCDQSVRGQILWSDTVVARAGAGGAEDLFVCARTGRTWDTPESRALVGALVALTRADAALARPLSGRLDPEVRRQVASVAAEAASWRRHPHLADVADVRLDGRSLAALRRGHRAGRVAPLLAIRARLREPFTAADVSSLAPAAARRVHDEVLARVHDETATLRVRGEALEIDGVRFGPWDWATAGTDGAPTD